jgi:uncharacterized protein (TIGR02217 family)
MTAVFPVLPGLEWDVKKKPIFSTIIQKTASGKEIRSALQSYPRWEFNLSFSILRTSTGFSEMQTLAGFFEQMLGQASAFNYSDPSDNSVTAQLFGTGDGTTTGFQLLRTMGSFSEPIQNLNGNPSIYINGVLKTLTTDYTINSTGFVTFVTAPALAASITWTGNFYYLCRFMEDVLEFNQFMYQLWELKKLSFISIKQ